MDFLSVYFLRLFFPMSCLTKLAPPYRLLSMSYQGTRECPLNKTEVDRPPPLPAHTLIAWCIQQQLQEVKQELAEAQASRYPTPP